jgi:hypothetical protein
MPRTRAQRKGEYCERKVRTDLAVQCNNVVDLRKGADFLCIKPDGSQMLVEAKCNRSQLTSYQKRTKETWESSGKKYKIKRCKCSDF